MCVCAGHAGAGVFTPPSEARLDPHKRWIGHRFSRNLACRAMGLNELSGEEDSAGNRAIFRRRRSWLFRKTVPGRRVTVRVGTKLLLEAACDHAGHFRASGVVSATELLAAEPCSPTWAAATRNTSSGKPLGADGLGDAEVMTIRVTVTSALEPGEQAVHSSSTPSGGDDGGNGGGDDGGGGGGDGGGTTTPSAAVAIPARSTTPTSSWSPWRELARSWPGAAAPVAQDRAPPSQDPTFAGRQLSNLLLVPPAGLSIISDIDDTIKESNVIHKRELMLNTFLREFVPVEGMSALYQRWQTELGNASGRSLLALPLAPHNDVE